MCLFCRIIERKTPAKIVFEDETAVAFEDINPQAPTHILIVPRRHLASISEMTAGDAPLIGHLFEVARDLAAKRGIAAGGYRTVINTGREAGQSVFHIHLHLLGGRPLSWPPG